MFLSSSLPSREARAYYDAFWEKKKKNADTGSGCPTSPRARLWNVRIKFVSWLGLFGLRIFEQPKIATGPLEETHATSNTRNSEFLQTFNFTVIVIGFLSYCDKATFKNYFRKELLPKCEKTTHKWRYLQSLTKHEIVYVQWWKCAANALPGTKRYIWGWKVSMPTAETKSRQLATMHFLPWARLLAKYFFVEFFMSHSRWDEHLYNGNKSFPGIKTCFCLFCKTKYGKHGLRLPWEPGNFMLCTKQIMTRKTKTLSTSFLVSS